jgi:hypothetical protein
MMRMLQKRRSNPAHDLALAMRIAAAQIECAPARAAAARDANAIPLLFAERMPNTVIGQLARSGRAIMRSLERMAPEDRPHAAEHLREIAAVIDAPRPPAPAKVSTFDRN